MNLDRLSASDVEDKVGFNNQNSVAVFSKFWMARKAAQERMLLKQSNTLVELLNKGERPSGTTLRDIVEDLEGIALRNGKVSKLVLSEHSSDGGVWSSSVYA
jgi:hypothetical protein